MYYTLGILILIGFISYGGEVRDTLVKNKILTWKNVILDRGLCNLKNKKTIYQNFMTGLGIKI